MSGRTQGDKNERSPAEKAKNIDILVKGKTTSDKNSYKKYSRIIRKVIYELLKYIPNKIIIPKNYEDFMY